MPRLIIASDPSFLEHQPHPGHPERSARLEALHDLPSLADLPTIRARPATVEELASVHREHYIDHVADLSDGGGGQLDADTWVSRGSWRAACHAAGASLDLTESLLAGEAEAGLGLVRPPGHHALSDSGMGFCVFNNTALAAQRAADLGNRVAIVDWDVHHGNGTESIFWKRGDVLFLSMHQYPHYPGTGAASDLGEGEGYGMTRNIPLGPGCRDNDYLHVMDQVFVPRLREFDPDLIVVSAGYDGHIDDPLASMALTERGYGQMTRQLRQVAGSTPLLLLLEGGYDVDALRMSVDATVSALLEPEQAEIKLLAPSTQVTEHVAGITHMWEEAGCP